MAENPKRPAVDSSPRGDVNWYAHSNARLSKLESFDPAVFVGDREWSQEVSDFVLALALAYNDFRDVVFAQSFLGRVSPSDMTTPSPELGNYAGFQAHLSRILAGLLRELILVIQGATKARTHRKFETMIKSLPERARDAWDSVVAAAELRPGNDPLAMLLVRVRHKVVFHYDTGEIGRGYRSAFIEKSDRVPYVSRGGSLETSRLYFADAAAQMYVIEVSDTVTGQRFLDADFELFRQVGHALREVVLMFINVRGGFRQR